MPITFIIMDIDSPPEEVTPQNAHKVQVGSSTVTAVHTQITEALRVVVDPELGENIVDLGMVRAISVNDSVVTIELALTIAGCPMRDQLERDARQAALRVKDISGVNIVIGAMGKGERAALMARARRLAQERALVTDIPSTARVLGVVSGKGGVGKSSITVNLASALAETGATVGLLDADIWGFSVPRMLGVEGPLEVRNKKMLPIERPIGDGLLRIVSMGFLSDEDEAIMWRGLVLNRAVQHFIEDVRWGNLDYLLIDMPPGTGDVQMGLARMLPRTELLIVTTPGLAAQKVAGRAADMAQKGNLRVAGVIENMSGFTCAHGEYYPLFGSGGGERLAEAIGVPLIAKIPIDSNVAEGGDEGEPAVLDPTSSLRPVFGALAQKILTEIAPHLDMQSCSARLIDQVAVAIQTS